MPYFPPSTPKRPPLVLLGRYPQISAPGLVTLFHPVRFVRRTSCRRCTSCWSRCSGYPGRRLGTTACATPSSPWSSSGSDARPLPTPAGARTPPPSATSNRSLSTRNCDVSPGIHLCFTCIPQLLGVRLVWPAFGLGRRVSSCPEILVDISPFVP